MIRGLAIRTWPVKGKPEIVHLQTQDGGPILLIGKPRLKRFNSVKYECRVRIRDEPFAEVRVFGLTAEMAFESACLLAYQQIWDWMIVKEEARSWKLFG